MTDKPTIFSGNDSRELWREINQYRRSDPKLWSLLYLLGCKLQALESRVEEKVTE